MSDLIHASREVLGSPETSGSCAAAVTRCGAALVPTPRTPIRVRVAVAEDLAFIDRLQKMHSHMVGWSPTKQIEANITAGRVLIAEELPNAECQVPNGFAQSAIGHRQSAAPIGYCISRDQYMKRDDVGIVYQLNVLPVRQRHLVGATLIKAVFARAAYGCRLFCCWCAQDLQANWFWESMGFVPLAFRTGSRRKQRIHIFWQRRVREGDDGLASPSGGGGGGTPYWFPAQTSAGAVAEDRLVLPIPPGTHWRDAKPVVLPGVRSGLPGTPDTNPGLPQTLPGGAPVRPRPAQAVLSKAQAAAIARSKSRHLGGVPAGKAAIVTSGGVRYIERADALQEGTEPPKSKSVCPRKPRHKNDPTYVAAARELRDRFLEEVNTGRLLPVVQGKYDVSRAPAVESLQPRPLALLVPV